MPTMPYWMNKTPEMVAMDRWFRDPGVPDLVTKYTNAIARVLASQQSRSLPATSDVLDDELPGKQLGAFANPRVTEREAQEQNVKCGPLEEAVGRCHILAFKDFELRSQSGRNL